LGFAAAVFHAVYAKVIGENEQQGRRCGRIRANVFLVKFEGGHFSSSGILLCSDYFSGKVRARVRNTLFAAFSGY
jgi:hypothetical protein